MVFDWFQRRSVQPKPAAETAAQVEAPPQETAAPEPSIEGIVGEDPQPSSPPPEPAPAGIDADALAWAREAYARLKAEQQAARPVESAVAAPAAPPPVPEAPPTAQPQLSQPPETVVQDAPPATPAPSSLSLLERAAAERSQRQQDLMEVALSPTSAPPPAQPSSLQQAQALQETSLGGTPVPASAEEAEPSLGDFDEAFTWSAEVLAAQGRRADQVSLEEIDWLARLRRGMEKTRRGLVSQLLETLGDDPLTPEVLDDLETTLLRADVGVQATDQVLDALRDRLNQEVVDGSEGLRFLKEQLRDLLEQPIAASGRELLAPERDRLNIWLMVGVNGVGKTTTLGKLANLAVRSGYSCLIAAADTFRAAAVEQVRIWGERSGVSVISNPSANADPAAVVFDAISSAKAKGTELVLVDTAGRLQTKHNLMEELSKVRRIVDKLAPEAAVESLLVLDASQGQNGLRQAMAFAKAAGLTGVVITKLDGSSRGGVALAVCREVGLPIRFIGAGEGLRDLRPFNSFEFVEALLAS
ncbi:MAG: signal recognition particle-docking protein FtsY [Cyanobium sp.]